METGSPQKQLPDVAHAVTRQNVSAQIGSDNHPDDESRAVSSPRSLERSRLLWHEAEQFIWKGGPEAKQHDRLAAIGGPDFASSAEGARFCDADGNIYLDYLMAWGTVLLGHAHRPVVDAAIRQLLSGTLFNLSHESEIDLARRLTKLIPGAEAVRFLVSGSEATSAAVRIARAATKRSKIIKYGFHGWLEWNQDEHPVGVLPPVISSLLNLKFNDISDLKSLFYQNPGQIACVIMEPVKDIAPDSSYLQQVKDLAHENKALLVFDEIKTGFRLCAGGAQEYFGVTADLGIFSKALANGFPLSVITGGQDIFLKAGDVWVNGTYHGWLPSIAAAHAVLDTIEREPVYDAIWRSGTALISGFNECMVRYGLRARLQGLPPMPRPRFPAEEQNTMMGIFSKMMRAGHYLHPNHAWFISYAHTAQDIDQTLQDLDKSVSEIVAG